VDLSFFLQPASSFLSAVARVVEKNGITARYGLSLSEIQAAELVTLQNEILCDFERVDFGGGVVDRLALAFCDSPYISQSGYPALLAELIELFYELKDETADLLPDDELIDWIKNHFDGDCQGSMALLRDRGLAEGRRLRQEQPLQDPEEDEKDCGQWQSGDEWDDLTQWDDSEGEEWLWRFGWEEWQ
jgi:hypothetical protein